jgi:hypothetical protein
MCSHHDKVCFYFFWGGRREAYLGFYVGGVLPFSKNIGDGANQMAPSWKKIKNKK